jgi:PAS domain S-box-containing protein
VTRGADDRQPLSLDSKVLWEAIECASDEAGLGVYVATLQTQPPQLLYVNATAAKLFGRPASELVGHLPWGVLAEADVAKVQAVFGRPAGAPPTVLDVTLRHADGLEIPVTLAAARIPSAIGELSFGFLRDVSHERVTLEALQRSEARFRFLVEAAPDGVVILQRGTIVFMNPKAARLLGVESVDAALGRPIASFLPPADAALAGQRIMAMLREGIEFPPSEYGVLADPTRVVEIKSIVCDWNGEPGVIAFARDVTERKAIQKRLVESDRLAALGTLAAGVAHEINNPLTYAQLSAQRISRMLDQLEMTEDARATLRSHLDDIQHGSSVSHRSRTRCTRS